MVFDANDFDSNDFDTGATVNRRQRRRLKYGQPDYGLWIPAKRT